MITQHVDIGTFCCETGYFTGRGRVHTHGARPNPATLISKRVVAGRLIVGLSVKNKPTWKPDDVISIVRRIREKQVGDPSASFISQNGIYKHTEHGRVVFEKSVQVVLINPGAPEKDFKRQLIELGEILAKQLKQETVIADLQVNGVTKGAWYVSPKKR